MNKCEESGGVYYCYKCLEGSNRGIYQAITITLNLNIKIKILPKYYLEYNTESDRCMLLFKGIHGELDHWVIGDSVMKSLY